MMDDDALFSESFQQSIERREAYEARFDAGKNDKPQWVEDIKHNTALGNIIRNKKIRLGVELVEFGENEEMNVAIGRMKSPRHYRPTGISGGSDYLGVVFKISR